ncbi:S15/NS1 RNA-binding domain-containing protein [Lentinus tigrinus ALCF2SS1-6]|uniref:S15/NS1 RNA-binding domain-containing protein n=2 Tax=Lentinus tigrinus TaxID=5365 RepID=A0A5C2SM63_9APHY|nr:S15/NS1 RNA-binding domain-containing protein [Lentinus tigrinus ALCF2SS1-6]
MLGAHLAQCSRTLASSSSARAASLHTSAVLQAVSTRTRKTQRTLKANVQRREELELQARQSRPHVVLGYKAGDEAKWQNCDLARVLITEEDIKATPAPSVDPASGTVQTSTFLNYGIGEKEREALFDVLPRLSQQGQVEAEGPVHPKMISSTYAKKGIEEQKKAAMFARMVDLRNANARGIAFENRRRIVAAFSEPENPTDTGRPEVQAALATMRIRNLWDHLSRCKKDIANRRSLRQLVHKRAKILRYLKSVDEDRYDSILERLGLERSAVEGELVV